MRKEYLNRHLSFTASRIVSAFHRISLDEQWHSYHGGTLVVFEIQEPAYTGCKISAAQGTDNFPHQERELIHIVNGYLLNADFITGTSREVQILYSFPEK